MLIYPHINPIAFSIGPFGGENTFSLSVRWYGVMYLVAFLLARWLGSLRGRRQWGENGQDMLDDLLFYAFLGIVIGGRLGQVLFYTPDYFLRQPLEIFAIWKGGMSFHGGFLGVLLAALLWAKKYGQTWLQTTDFIAPLIPLGLMLGRIGNFINGEIWGRVADPALPWAMVFPHVDALPRHPVQFYHAGLEGLTLFCILWWFSQKPRPQGAVSALFLIGYGVFRFCVEFFREPDPGIFGHSYTVSMGQWLSLPMLALGGFLLWQAYRKKGQIL